MVRAGQTGFRLALPRGVRPGAYRFDVTFAADGALDGVTKRMALVLRR